MSKKPLLTRSVLRQKRENSPQQLEKPEETSQERHFSFSRQQAVPQQKITDQQAQKELTRQEKQISSFYRKENKKLKPLKRSRSGANQRSRDLNRFLTVGIVVVSLLIVVVMLATFFL